MSLDIVRDVAETANYIMGTIAIIVGGIWVYWKFIYQRSGKWNLFMKVTADTLQYDAAHDLLKINVLLRNEGNVKISPGESGCRLTVKKLDRNLQENQIVDPDRGEPIVSDHDILRKYYRPDTAYKRYEIEPKSEYHEVEAVIVPKDCLLSVRVEFFWKDNSDSITEYCFYPDNNA
jgi:hypothetical protein